MREVERLYRLQELDDEIALCGKRIQECIGRRERLQRSLAEAQQARQEGEKALRRQEFQLHQAEGDLRALEKRLQGFQQRLYGGAIRSEKELSALQSEIEQGRQQKDALEEDILQQMLDLDDLQDHLQEMADAEPRKARECEATLQEIAVEEAALQGRITPLRETRAGLAAELQPASLVLYEQIRRERGGMAVARVVDNTCAGCRLEVAVLTRKAAMGEDLVRCEYCGCILHVG